MVDEIFGGWWWNNEEGKGGGWIWSGGRWKVGGEQMVLKMVDQICG